MIVVEQHIAKKNDIRTKQGLVLVYLFLKKKLSVADIFFSKSVHKELQREIRAEELKVDITTKETQWALR